MAAGRATTGRTYAFSFVWTTAGTYTYRAVVPGTSLNATAATGAVKVKVRVS
ncbi:hypothetical protein AB0J83_31615 [Actinoplanes sp. NPDC049596]|uniref:hypothetical protein n=1 Tax=unclassified Actinoplanes TaxID=2626549 RepID=UPI0034342973